MGKMSGLVARSIVAVKTAPAKTVTLNESLKAKAHAFVDEVRTEVSERLPQEVES